MEKVPRWNEAKTCRKRPKSTTALGLENSCILVKRIWAWRTLRALAWSILHPKIGPNTICDIVAGEQAPSCISIRQIPNMKLTHVRFIEPDLLDHEPYELSNRKRDRRITNEFNSVKHLGNPDVEYIETKNRGTASETYLKNDHLKRKRQRKKSYPKKSFCFYHI